MGNTIEATLTGNLDQYMILQNDYQNRLNQSNAYKNMVLMPIKGDFQLSNWYPRGYNITLEKPVLYTPPIPGRINHEKYGNCYIHASCQIFREAGEFDHTMFLVTCVDAIEISGVPITNKRQFWYEVPATLMVNNKNLPGFCAPVPCMIDTIDYNDSNPGSSSVTLVYGDKSISPTVMTLSDLVLSKDPNFILAFTNFKFDYKYWVIDKKIEQRTLSSVSYPSTSILLPTNDVTVTTDTTSSSS